MTEQDIRKKVYEGYSLKDQTAPPSLVTKFLVALFIPLSAYIIYEVFVFQEAIRVHWAILSIFLGWLFADFMSGLVHWFADNYLSKATPLIGKGLILPFRHHHVEPMSIVCHNFFETNANSVVLAVVAGLIPASLWLAYFGCPVYFMIFWQTVVSFVSITNQTHAWSHALSPPLIARILQKLRIIQPRERHALHHRLPHNNNYCITSGAMNWPLEKIGFFPALEKVIFYVTKVHPEHKRISDQAHLAGINL